MSTSIIGLAALCLVGGSAFWWRALSRRRHLPCPAWLAWVLENPYTNALAGSTLLIDRAGIGLGMRVLDAGSGPGRLTIPVAERVGPSGEVVALDLQAAMLAQVRRRAGERGVGNVRTLLGALECLIRRADDGVARFDRALLVAVLGEIPDRAAAMNALYDTLVPGGLLSVTEILPDPHFQTRRTVRRLAEGAGFQLQGTYGVWFAFTMNFRKSA